MNKISKIGLAIEALTFTIMITLILFGQKVPDFLMYTFWIGLIVTFVGALVNHRENQNKN